MSVEGMALVKLVGKEVYLRLEDDSELMEVEEDGHVLAKVTGLDQGVGLWIEHRSFPIRENGGITPRIAQYFIPFRNLKSIAMVDLEAEEAAASEISLEEAMGIVSNVREELEQKAATRVNASGGSYRGAKLDGANLKNIKMSETDLEGVDFSGAILVNGYFKDSNFKEAKLTGADLTNAYLWQASLESTMLESSNLKGANLWCANLKNANLARANLERTNFTEANMEEVRLTGATIKECKLYGAKLDGIIATVDELNALAECLKGEAEEHLEQEYLDASKWCCQKADQFYTRAKNGPGSQACKTLMNKIKLAEEETSAQ